MARRLSLLLAVMLCASVLIFPPARAADKGFYVGVTIDEAVCYAGGSFTVRMNVSGGQAPYKAVLNVTAGKSLYWEEEFVFPADGTYAASISTEKAGLHAVNVLVTDSANQSSSGKTSISVFTRTYETPMDWLDATDCDLTGDWRADLLSVAKTQLGYRASTTITGKDGRGNTRGYTRYGHWMGDPYMEWCAAYVSFCFEYADIPIASDLKIANVPQWIKSIKALHAWHDASDNYIPSPGDLAFIVPSSGTSHMGIVEFVSGRTVGTIEGNVSNAVDRRSYLLDQKQIAGFASMADLMSGYGIKVGKAPSMASITDLEPVKARTVSKNVNLRSGPSMKSPRILKIDSPGTRVTVHACLETEDGTLWYLVTFRNKIGYIRSDMLRLPE